MKKYLIILLVVCMVLGLTGCGETKVLHCDHCNKEVVVSAKSNMEEDWIIFCDECNKELFSGDPVLGAD